jgi:hypothetical protein
MSEIGQGRNREMSNNLDMREQFRLRYFEIIDTVTGEMKHRFTENDAVLNALSTFSPHSLSLFSDELLNSLAEKYQSLLNVNVEPLHSHNNRCQEHISKPQFPDGNVQATVYNALASTAFVQIGFDCARCFCLCGTQFFRDAQNQESFRASMSETRTSDPSLISVERELSDSIMHNPSSAAEAFAAMGKRRPTLSYVDSSL